MIPFCYVLCYRAMVVAPLTQRYLLTAEQRTCVSFSVTSKKSPNVTNTWPQMISLEKLKILKLLQKLPKNVVDLGKLIVATGFKIVAQSTINRPIWSYWFH